MRFLIFCIFLNFSMAVARVTVNPTARNRNHNLTDSNMCTRLERQEETRVLPRSTIVRESFKAWCIAIPPVCTYHRYKLVIKNETVTVEKFRTVLECCKGYKSVNKSCVPICPSGCGHGVCVEPSLCHCKEGWRGVNCSQPCERNTFGPNCKKSCFCEHGAECDKKTGACICPPGYVGDFCEDPCPQGTYGRHCELECDCEHGAICDIKDGFCECPPGYYGDYCEEICEYGRHGQDCSKDCICMKSSTEHCSHIDGTCTCKPGYTGKYCENYCSNYTYGRDCEKECDCVNAEFCDPIFGECFCNTGWIGNTCDEECAEGFFGDGCKDECEPCQNDSSCNHVTGTCDCVPGKFGEFCEKTCPEGLWGSDCKWMCNCSDNRTCDAKTGECLCLAGWIGSNCSESCPSGKYGINCLSDCNCTHSCDVITGSCNEHTANPHVIKSDQKTKLVVGFSVICAVMLLFLCGYCIKYLLPNFINWCSLRGVRDVGSSEDILAGAFPNPLYYSVERRENPERSGTLRSLSFVNLASTIENRSTASLTSLAEANAASNSETVTDQGSTLKRASKVSNLSARESLGKLFRNSKTSVEASGNEKDEDFTPEVVTDFNTAENIIGNASDNANDKNEEKKMD